MLVLCITTYAIPDNIIRVIPPQHKYISEIHNNILIISDDNDRYLYDIVTNKKLFSSQTAEKLYDEFVLHTDYINKKCWLTDYQNSLLFEFPENVIMDHYKNGLYVISNWETYKSGLMSKTGEYIIECIYNRIYIGNDNNVYLSSDNETLIYNIETKTSSLCNLDIISVFNNMNHVKIKDDNEKIGIANFSGVNLTDIKYDSIKETFDEYYLCSYGNIVDIVNFAGNIVLTIDGYVEDIKDGIFFVSLNNGTMGYMDLSGTIVIPLKDTYNGSVFQNGYAAVRDNYKYGGGASYIDRTGARATEKSWDMTYNFSNGYAFVMNKSKDDVSNKYIESWYIIDENFDVVKELEYNVYTSIQDTKHDISPDFIRIKDNKTGNYGYIHIVNNMTTDKTYYNLTYQANGGNGNIHRLNDVSINSRIEVVRCFYTRDGYTFSHWTDGTNIYYPGDTFIMPDHDVTMTAIWTQNQIVIPPVTPTPTPSVPEYQCPYTDITDHWAKDYIIFTHKNNLIDGITATEFRPKEPMTREMFVIALARMMGIEKDYIDWAVDIGLIVGYGNGNLGLEDTITREQMAVFFERYLNLTNTNIDLLKQQDKVEFTDDATISDWAKSSVYKMQEIKLLKGKENMIFDPLDEVSRAEGATVIYNLGQILK